MKVTKYKGQKAMLEADVKNRNRELKQISRLAENRRINHGQSVAELIDQSDEVAYKLCKAKEE